MTPERQQHRIAELVGWTNVRYVEDMGLIGHKLCTEFVPDYLNSRDEMVQLAETCMGLENDLMAGWLYLIVKGKKFYPHSRLKDVDDDLSFITRHDLFCFMRATAAQMAEAFLRAKGEWEEATPP